MTSSGFAQATAAPGVRSTLTFPILQVGRVVGTVNLYGRTDTAFDGKHSLLATVFDGWAPAPSPTPTCPPLREDWPSRRPLCCVTRLITAAAGILAAAADLDEDLARASLEEAAARAGVPVTRLARLVLGLHTGRG